MNRERLEGIADLDAVAAARICVAGCGASVDLIVQLARFGARRFVLVDPDVVAPENICRQGFYRRDIGEAKVDAVARRLRMVDEAIDVCTIQQRFDPSEIGDADLFLSLTDSTEASLSVNQAALRQRSPAIWAGVYAQGLAGEVAFWREGLPCFRCLFPQRVSHTERPSSTSVSIFDTAYIDAIVGQLAIGLLSGPNFRLGRMTAALGSRNFLRVKIDPSYDFQGRDVVRSRLGIAPDNANYFAWCTSAESDPDGGLPPCPDCAAFQHQAIPA